MDNYFDKEFDLRYFEMDKTGEASPITMMTLLQETAADHCYVAGHSLFSLMSQNLGWVLLSGITAINELHKISVNDSAFLIIFHYLLVSL